ncbi:hypothetical protein CKJ61_07545 [Mycobacterium intracellulare]|nr:hypothetical protein CKJ61_07545 [Mycobacterium intracellulare]
MTPEQLAKRFPNRFRYFDLYVEHGRRRGSVTEGLRAYNADLARWVAEEFGELPEALVDKARAIYGCSVSDWYRHALST